MRQSKGGNEDSGFILPKITLPFKPAAKLGAWPESGVVKKKLNSRPWLFR
jgi:hypothetical protein